MRAFLNILLASSFFSLAQAQTERLVKVPDYPVEFNYPQDFSVSQEGKSSWTIYDKEVGTEFYVNLYKVTDLFTADSLRYLMQNLYKNDPEVSNIQINQVGSGSFGTKRAERCELSFSVGDARYSSISYLVYMYLNNKVNALLFYFEIGSNNVVSYGPLQDQMITSLKYTPFNYTSFLQEEDSVKFEYPDFWTIKRDEKENTKVYITDYRYELSYTSVFPKDSTTARMSADLYKDKIKLNTVDFPAIKVKSGNDKFNGINGASVTGTYMKKINSVERKVNFERYFVRKTVNGKEVEFIIEITIPDIFKEYYAPIDAKIKSSITLPGIILEKK